MITLTRENINALFECGKKLDNNYITSKKTKKSCVVELL